MKQNITITFDGWTGKEPRTIENFSMHQIGGDALQVVYGNKAVIYPMVQISQVDIEQVEVSDNIIDVQVKE